MSTAPHQKPSRSIFNSGVTVQQAHGSVCTSLNVFLFLWFGFVHPYISIPSPKSLFYKTFPIYQDDHQAESFYIDQFNLSHFPLNPSCHRVLFWQSSTSSPIYQILTDKSWLDESTLLFFLFSEVLPLLNSEFSTSIFLVPSSSISSPLLSPTPVSVQVFNTECGWPPWSLSHPFTPGGWFWPPTEVML